MSATPHPPHALISDTAVLDRVATDLAAKFVGVFSTETVHHYVFESSTALRRTAKIKPIWWR